MCINKTMFREELDVYIYVCMFWVSSRGAKRKLLLTKGEGIHILIQRARTTVWIKLWAVTHTHTLSLSYAC